MDLVKSGASQNKEKSLNVKKRLVGEMGTTSISVENKGGWKGL